MECQKEISEDCLTGYTVRYRMKTEQKHSVCQDGKRDACGQQGTDP